MCVHHTNTKKLLMCVYKRHPPYSHLGNSPIRLLNALYGVFHFLHIIISENIYKHLIGDFRGFLFENVYHLWIEFIRCITKLLTKICFYGIYIYPIIKRVE